MPAPPSFFKKLAKMKFDPERDVAFDTCSICLLEFTPEDEIIPLPCDEKHIFHP
jgi:hypothetical protein